MEWIGNEIKKDRPKNEWVESESSIASSSGKKEQKKQTRRLEWWASLDDGRMKKKEKNRKKPREWWKEEFCEELARKKKRKELSSKSCRDLWWQRDEDSTKMKKVNKNSKGSIDWWLDGRRNSLDGGTSDIPKSGGISSTPSMRGTICYIAPEYGGGGQISEKCDVYSFGVLLLVLVSGRRPLQVMASPISEFDRANLISWARQLARNGKLLDLIDPSIHSLDKEQALLCITIALLCLQRSPSKRPTMNEIVAVLSGEAEAPLLPFEFSPSPPSNLLFKSQRKATRWVKISCCIPFSIHRKLSANGYGWWSEMGSKVNGRGHDFAKKLFHDLQPSKWLLHLKKVIKSWHFLPFLCSVQLFRPKSVSGGGERSIWVTQVHKIITHSASEL